MLKPGSVTKQNNAIGPNAVARGNLENNIIGNEQLDGNSVDRANIRNNAVGKDQIEGGAIQANHLSNNARNLFADSNHNHNNDYEPKAGSGNNAFATKGYVDGKVPNDVVTTKDLAKGATGSKELATKEWVTQELKKIKDKGGGGN